MVPCLQHQGRGGHRLVRPGRRGRRCWLGIVADADRLLELSRRAQGKLPEDSDERQRIVAAAELLGRLLLQDVERTDDGVSRDRMMSVHDPETRHGHKSSSRRFDGHKAAIVVDTNSQLFTAVEVLLGNAPDNLGALELVEASEANTGVPVEEAMGDAAAADADAVSFPHKLPHHLPVPVGHFHAPSGWQLPHRPFQLLLLRRLKAGRGG